MKTTLGVPAQVAVPGGSLWKREKDVCGADGCTTWSSARGEIFYPEQSEPSYPGQGKSCKEKRRMSENSA